MKNNLFDSLIGLKLTNIIFQPTAGIISPTNMFVLNFKKGKVFYSLHAFTFLRIMQDNRILLCSSDEFVNNDLHLMDSDGTIEDSIIGHNINNVKKLSRNATVTQATLFDCGDVQIKLSNNVIIDIIIDSTIDGFEYYRLFDYNSSAPHMVVENVNGEITGIFSPDQNSESLK